MLKIKTDESIYNHDDKVLRRIASFWDQISEGWLQVWGPHIHHGYYEGSQGNGSLEAQEKLLEKLTALIEIPDHAKILDVGCGMGGSSIYLAEKYQASVTGITLSKKQVAIARTQAKEKKIEQVNFTIEDALSLQSFQDNSFDILWSLESCEQFCDKNLFFKQAFRVLKPGGFLVLATWCSSEEEYEGKSARQYKKLCYSFDLPYMPTIKKYQTLLRQQNLRVVNTLNWSSQVKQSWDIGISRLNTYSLLQIIRLGGWRGFRFARQVKLMRDAFEQDRVHYGVFIATKS